MAEIINDLQFEAIIDPEKYTDIEQLNKDVAERNFHNAQMLLNNREITSNKYRAPLPDNNVYKSYYILTKYEDTLSTKKIKQPISEFLEKAYLPLTENLQPEYLGYYDNFDEAKDALNSYKNTVSFGSVNDNIHLTEYALEEVYVKYDEPISSIEDIWDNAREYGDTYTNGFGKQAQQKFQEEQLQAEYKPLLYAAEEEDEEEYKRLRAELENKIDAIYSEHTIDNTDQTPPVEQTDEQKTIHQKSFATYLEVKAETDPAAANELGVLYYLKNDIDIATQYFEKAVSMDYAEAQRNLAIILEQNSSSDLERIFSLYEAAAQQKDPAALNNLGCCYLDGDGVEADIKKAIKCFERAVDQNDTLAMINLADCYAIGNGVRINPVKAFKLYEAAAKTENPTALARLAECYEVGAGTKQSLDKALEYYQAAVDKGNEDVSEKLEQLLRKRVGIRYDLGTTMDDDKKQAVEASEMQAATKNKNQPSL